MKSAPSFAVALAFLTAVGQSMALADTFVLTNGGRVTGELVNRDESPRKKYVVQTTEGAEVTFEAAQVRQWIRPRPNEVEYEQIRSTYPDTAGGQWDLAQWCRDHHLNAQREIHLRRVIELDPDQVEARRVLGYSKVDGKWVTRSELMTQRGFVLAGGKWVPAQEKEEIESKRKLQSSQQEWFKKVKRWRTWLDDGREQQAREEFHRITDPAAVKALDMALSKETSAAVQLLYVEVLAKIDSVDAVRVLAITSVDNDVDEVRLSCLDSLQTKPRPDVVNYYKTRLRDKDHNPIIINRAALGLGRMKDPSAIGELIEALVSVRKVRVPQPGGEGATTASMGGFKGGPSSIGLNAGGGPKFELQASNNPAVLDALIALTNQNFGFNQQAWRYWHRAQRKPETFDARRG